MSAKKDAEPAADDPNVVKHGTPTEDANTGERLRKQPAEPAAKTDTVAFKHGVAQTPANVEAAKGKEEAAADPVPVKKGMPKGVAGGVDEPEQSKADIKRAALADEFERLKAEGKTDTPRFEELKKQIAKGQTS